jgi:hypothetical protein
VVLNSIDETRSLAGGLNRVERLLESEGIWLGRETLESFGLVTAKWFRTEALAEHADLVEHSPESKPASARAYFERLQYTSDRLGEVQASLARGELPDDEFWAASTANLQRYQQEIESLEAPEELRALHSEFVSAAKDGLLVSEAMTQALRSGLPFGQAALAIFSTSEVKEINQRAEQARSRLKEAAKESGIDLRLVAED